MGFRDYGKLSPCNGTYRAFKPIRNCQRATWSIRISIHMLHCGLDLEVSDPLVDICGDPRIKRKPLFLVRKRRTLKDFQF